ncbi:MAG: DUF1173 family protein, partial [Burkholderiales bacterium]|nr:DUF1173 family protein [Burkholderiales bacterium]
AEFDTFLAGLTNESGKVQRGIVVGEIGEIGDTQYGKSLTLRQSAKKYYASQTLIDHAAATYSHAWRAIGERSARVVAVLLVERTPKGHLKLIDLAAKLCSSSFIPCDSIREVAMANRLVAEHRDFVKPTRMADGDDMLPDFELTDTDPIAHVEVYGMNGLASYEARKAAKRALRLQRDIPCVEWNVDREALAQVALPPPARPSTSRA